MIELYSATLLKKIKTKERKTLKVWIYDGMLHWIREMLNKIKKNNQPHISIQAGIKHQFLWLNEQVHVEIARIVCLPGGDRWAKIYKMHENLTGRVDWEELGGSGSRNRHCEHSGRNDGSSLGQEHPSDWSSLCCVFRTRLETRFTRMTPAHS